MRKALYPEHGTEYDRAMQDAERLYKEWLVSRKDMRGIQLFATRKNPTPDIEE